MKKKVLLIILFIFLTIIIYFIYKNDKDTYLALGDIIAKGTAENSYNDYVAKYIKDKKHLNKYYDLFMDYDLRTNDLINRIKENYKPKESEITIQQALIKSNIITLSVGTIDLYNHLGITSTSLITEETLNNYFLNMFTDLDKLLKLLKKFTPGRIIVIGFYNPVIDSDESLNKVFEYIDSTYSKIVERNNCEYISLKEISSNQKYLLETSIYLNEEGHKYISEVLIKQLKL